MKFTVLLVLTASLLGLVSTAKSTVLGLPDPTNGTLWDTFSAVTFTDATGTGTNSFMSATLSSASGSGSVAGEGDRLYTGSRAATAAVDLTINGTAKVSLDSLTVYLKYTPASETGQILDYFTVTLDGVSAIQFSLGGTGEIVSGGEMNVVRLTWTGLSFAANDDFNISITRPAAGSGEPGHVSIDAVQIVREPSTGVLVGLGLALACVRRRTNRPNSAIHHQ